MALDYSIGCVTCTVADGWTQWWLACRVLLKIVHLLTCRVLGRLVIVKLDGGQGTSMGLSGPKSLLEVKPGASFLDVLATQVLALRERHGARLPLVLMNSATTRDPSLDALRRYDGLRVPGVPLDFLSIPGARALQVPRSRFAPVKTTDDLLVVRSDAYELTSDGRMRPSFDGPAPVVTLDKDFYKLLPDFEQRFPAGAPSLRRCRRFQVDGDVTFGAGVMAVGDVRVTGPRHVPDGELLGG